MWRYSALVWLLFVVNRQESRQVTQIVVKPKTSLCIEPGRMMLLTCILHTNMTFVNITTSSLNWSLQWCENEVQLTNATTVHYTNNSVVSTFVPRSSGLFTCVGKGPSQCSNSSVFIGIQPQPVHTLMAPPKFTRDKDGFSYVMVSWLRPNIEYEYTLFYKIDLNGCFSMPCVDDFIKVRCNATKCSAIMETEGNDLSDLSFYLLTRHKACEARSKVWSYNLTLTSCGELPPRTLFCIPFPPTKLEIDTSYRKVILRWQDTLYWQAPAVLLTCNCPKTSANRTGTELIMSPPEIRTIRLSDKDILGYVPYGKCTLCLSIQEYHCGQFSEPLCKTTRLNEEAPSKPPAITCKNDTCPTSYDKDFLNLTIMWELPAEKYWGGILREIRLRYWVNSPNSALNGTLIRNATSHNAATIKQLNKTLDYTIRLQACNKKGCSSYSEPFQVTGIRATPRYLTITNSSDNFTIEWFPIIIGGVAAFLLLVVTVYLTVKKFRSSFEPVEQSQESISPPDIPDYSQISDSAGNYDELPHTSQSSAGEGGSSS